MPTTTRNTLRLTAFAAAIATICVPHAYAQQAPVTAQQKPADAGAIDKVEVRGSAAAYDPRRDDTASKFVITQEEIAKYGDTSTLEVLKRVPGITIGGAPGRGSEVRMRGLGNGYTQVLINGEPMPRGFSLDSLSPDIIERIEVMRAATAEFSTQAVAGTINVILKKTAKTGQRELKANVAGGEHLASPALNLLFSDRAGNRSWSVPLNAFYRRADRPSTAEERDYDNAGLLGGVRHIDTMDANHVLTVNAAPRVNWALDGGDSVTWQGFLNVSRAHDDEHTGTLTSLGRGVPYPDEHSAGVNNFGIAKSDFNWIHKLASGAKLDLKLTGAAIAANNITGRDGWRGGAQVLDSVTEIHGHDYTVTSTGKYTNPLLEGHVLALGWDAGNSRHFESRDQDDAAIGGSPAYSLDESFQARSTRLAMYAQDEWRVTERWSLYLGARWEGIRIQTSGNDFTTARTNSSVLSPLLQTMYKLGGANSDQLRFAVTRTYKAPDLLSLPPRRYISLNNSPTEPDVMGNPNLRPELALGFDAGYEHYFGEGGLLSLNASRRSIQDFTRNLVSFQDGRWVQMPVNEGTAQTSTLEAEAKVPLKALFENAPALDLRASVSRNWSRVSTVPGPDNRLDQQTPLSATLGADYKAGALSAGASLAFRAGGPVRLSQQQASYQNVRRDLDVYALWKFNPRTQLRVALSNLLGEDSIAGSSYATPAGLSTRTTLTPGWPVARVTLEMKL